MLLGYETFDSYWSVEVLNFSNETLVFLILNVFEHNEGAKKKLMGPTVTSSLKLLNELTQKEPKKTWEAQKPEKIKTLNSIFILALARKNCNTLLKIDI